MMHSSVGAQFGNRGLAECNALSSYTRALTTKDVEYYLNKLTLTNGDRLPDPCGISEWVEEVSVVMLK